MKCDYRQPFFHLVYDSMNNPAKKTKDIKDTDSPVVQMSETPAMPDTIFAGFVTEPFGKLLVHLPVGRQVRG